QIAKSSSGTWSPWVTAHPVMRNATSSLTAYPSVGFDPTDVCYAYRDKSAHVCWSPSGEGADSAMGPVAARFQTFRFENRVYGVALTDLVMRWARGTLPNEGLFLEVHGTGEMAQFRSMEDADPSLRPMLDVIYQREP